MIEGFAQEMPEDEMVDAILFAHETIREIIALQQELFDKIKPEKIEYTPPENDGLFDKLKSAIFPDNPKLLQVKSDSSIKWKQYINNLRAHCI